MRVSVKHKTTIYLFFNASASHAVEWLKTPMVIHSFKTLFMKVDDCVITISKKKL